MRLGTAHRALFTVAIGVAACGSSFESTKVWTSSSASLRLGLQYWPQGVAAWERSRADLTPTQLATLDRLVSRPPVSSKVEDAQEVLVHVTDVNGTSADYRVVLGNADARGVLDERLPTIDYWAIRPLLDGVKCLLSEATRDEAKRAGNDPVTGNPLPPWSVAPSMNDDPGCIHTTMLQAGAGTTWVRLEPSANGKLVVELVTCGPSAALRARSNDGLQEIATSAPVAPPTCPTLPLDLTGPVLVGIDGEATQLRVRR